ncbi:MAG: DUF2306 domain-containing protein, partial [Hyphomonadaceae bacterium]|nr:DUF2306 domain-containing protein [Hyphomonadaceae bacterium]
MTMTLENFRQNTTTRPHRGLAWAAAAWFATAALGQVFFVIYMSGFYGTSAVRGRFEDWSAHRNVIDAYVAGDLVGNIQFGVHVLMALVLTAGGVLQLWPALRNRFRAVHRWNGRLYLVAAVVAAVGGLWLNWVRGSRLDLVSALGVSLNGVLILWFAAMVLRAALSRRLLDHEAWAVRLFLAVSGVWMLRVGMMAYGLLGIGALGLPRETGGLFFALWSFGSFLVPLVVYEIYRRVKAGGRDGHKTAMTGALAV